MRNWYGKAMMKQSAIIVLVLLTMSIYLFIGYCVKSKKCTQASGCMLSTTTLILCGVNTVHDTIIKPSTDWHDQSTPSAQKYTIQNICKKLFRRTDSWRAIDQHTAVLSHQ